MRLQWNSHKLFSPFSSHQTLPAEPHTITWGENQETTTDSDGTDSDGTNAEQENEDNSETQQKDGSEKNSKQESEDTLTSYMGNSPTTQHMLIHEQRPTTPLPTIEPLPYSSESELTGVPMTASMTPNDGQGSSSVEPGWGRMHQRWGLHKPKDNESLPTRTMLHV